MAKPIAFVLVVLFRWVLPPALLAAAIFRYNLFSLLYFLALLGCVLLKGRGSDLGPRLLLFGILCVSVASLLGQGLFQISRATNYAKDKLDLCNDADRVTLFEQLGFDNMADVDGANIARLIVPDIGICLLTVAILIVARRAAKAVPADEGDGEARRKKGVGVPDWLIAVLSVFSDLIFLVFLFLASSTHPSVLSAVYGVSLLAVCFFWAYGVGNETWIRVLRGCIVLYAALHLLVLYLYQFNFFQEDVEPGGSFSEIFGFTAIVNATTGECASTKLSLSDHVKWSVYLSPVFIFLLYWLSAFDLRSFKRKPQVLDGLGGNARDGSGPVQAGGGQGDERRKLLASDEGPRPNYSAVSTTTATPTSVSEEEVGDHSDGILSPVVTKAANALEGFFHLVLSLSYILLLIVMMVWSIAYHSWFTFVLLVSACILWIVPNTQLWTLRVTPLLTIYGSLLLGLDYTVDTAANAAGGEPGWAKKIIVAYHSNPLPHLMVKMLFFSVFLIALRRFIIGDSQPQAQQRSETDDPEEPETKGVRSKIKSFATVVLKFARTYWLLVCYGAYLLASLIPHVTIFKMVYMLLFLIFFISYQLSGKLWKSLLTPLWWIAVLYSMFVVITIYTYQFDSVAKAWNGTFSSNATISVQWIRDFGLETYNKERLFAELLLPVVVLVVVILQLRYFHKPPEEEQMPLPLKAGYRNFENHGEDRSSQIELSTCNGASTTATQVADLESDFMQPSSERSAANAVAMVAGHKGSEGLEGDEEERSWKDYLMLVGQRLLSVILTVFVFIWRFLEIHLDKVILLVIVLVCLTEVCAANVVALLFVCLVLVSPSLRPLCYIAFNIWGLVSIFAKMAYQLHNIKTADVKLGENCPPAIKLFNNTGEWFGLKKTMSFPSYIQGYLWVLVLIALRVVVRRHQSAVRAMAHQDRSKNSGVEQVPKRGFLFAPVSRAEADKDLLNAFKYLVDHCFQLFGIEITFLVCAILIAERADVVAVFYAILLGILLVISDKMRRLLWPILFIIVPSLLLMLQYFLLLGLPPGVCEGYFWSSWKPELQHWMFLPGDHYWVVVRPDKWSLIGDFLLLLSASVQMEVFRMKEVKADEQDVENDGSQQCKIRDFTQNETWLDLLKIVVFQHFFWIVLAMILAAGTTRNSLLCLGYLIIAFIFLFKGGEQLQFRLIKLLDRWWYLLFYTYLVIFVKTFLQLWVCVWASTVPCAVAQLLSIVCLNPLSAGSIITGRACQGTSQTVDTTGIALDVTCLGLLLLQLRIFSSPYFTVVQQHLGEIVQFAPDGLRILRNLQNRRRHNQQRKEHEELRSIQEKVMSLEHDPHSFQILYAGTSIPEVLAKNEFSQRRDSVSTILSEDSHPPPSSWFEQKDLAARAEERASEDESESEKEVEDDEGTSSETATTKGQKKKKKERSLFEKIGKAISDFLDKSVITWLDQVAYDYLYVETRLARLRLLKRCERAGTAAGQAPLVEEAEAAIAPRGTVQYFTRKIVSKLRSSLNFDHSDEEKEEDVSDSDALAAVADVETDKMAAVSSEPARIFDSDKAEGEASEKPSLIEPVEDLLATVKASAATDRLAATEALLRSELADVIYLPARLGWAIYYAVLARTDVVCYFLMILDMVLSGHLLAMPLPFFVFLWALLSKPRPSTYFWKTMITYVLVMILIKYFFQNPIIDYGSFGNGILSFPNVLGIRKESNFARAFAADIVLLLALCFHRAVLRLHGLWELDASSDVESFKELSIQKSRKESSDEPDAVRFAADTSDNSKEEDAGVCNWFVRFFRVALNPNRGGGRKDYYSLMFLFDLICFLTTIFGWSAFAEASEAQGGDVKSFISQNYIPHSFLAIMLIQFLLIVVDRIIYLRKWLRGKLIFQIVLLILVHSWMFFILPDISEVRFVDNHTAQFWYFSKCVYFGLSSLQISSGYPTRILENFLTKRTTFINAILFIGTQAIPFLLELRGLLDWACTDTVLTLMYWFKVEDIYSSVFVIKSFREQQKEAPRKLGDTMDSVIKGLVGGLGVAAIIFVLWFPLLLMSLVNSSSLSNTPNAITVQLAVGGFEPLFHFTADSAFYRQLSPTDYSGLKDYLGKDPVTLSFLHKYKAEDIVRARIPGESGSVWSISPPARKLLRSQLVDKSELLGVRWSWTILRTPPTGLAAESVSDSHTLLNDTTVRDEFQACLDNSSNHVWLPGLIPTYILSPANGEAVRLVALNGSRLVNVKVTLKHSNTSTSGNVEEWWSVEQVTPHILPGPVGSESDIEIFIFSDRVAAPEFSFLAGKGVIGLYISLVLVIGQFLRLIFKNISHRIMFEDMPNPDAIFYLCKNIFLVRESGLHSLEERLVGQLFLIYRSPDKMVEMTRATPGTYKVKRD